MTLKQARVNGGNYWDAHEGATCLVIRVVTHMKEINEFLTVPVYHPAKPRPREKRSPTGEEKELCDGLNLCWH